MKDDVQDGRRISQQGARSTHVFYDATGHRKALFNFAVPLLFFILVLVFGFTSFYVHRVIDARGLVQASDLPVLKNTGVAMLYTDNAPHSTAVIGDQLVNLDTLFMPRFLYRDGSFTVPRSFRDWDVYAKDIGTYRPVHYKLQYILSARNYELLPTERMNSSNQENHDNRVIATAFGVNQMHEIAKQVKQSQGSGLYIELNLSLIDSPESAEKLSDWLNDFKSVLSKERLSMGIIYQGKEANSFTAPVLKTAPAHYITFNIDTGIGEQISNLKKYDSQLATNITYELPTVSTLYNLDEFNNYIASMTYAENQEKLINRTITGRSVEPISITNPSSYDQVRDAVSVNNVIRSLTNNLLLRESTSYAIANPGFEEYTTWNLISRPADLNYAKTQLSSNLYSSLKIDQEGSGYVQELANRQSPGSRTIDMDKKGSISSSAVTKPETNALVKLSGQRPKKIALTFDDGPGREHTKRVLDVLDSYGVKGTFFMIGENVIANSEVALEVARRGHEIENHSYDHPKFDQISGDSQISQLVATSKIIEEVAAVKVKYFRQPYSVDTAIETTINIDYLDRLKSVGLQASEYDIDSKDWSVATAAESVKRVVSAIDSSDGAYSQILFHDNHDNIDVTLEALPIIISELKARDIDIVRVDELANNRPTLASIPAETNTLLAMRTKDTIITAVVWVNVVLIGLSLIKYGWIFLGMAMYTFKRYYRHMFVKKLRSQESRLYLPCLTAIIACYNEELVIERTLQSLIDCNYPRLKIIVVNDGSKDDTADVVNNFAVAHPNVTLYTVPNGGKARALEFGISKTRANWLVFCDADTIFDNNALHNFAYSTMSDNNLGAVAGQIVVGNDINALTRAQVIEYGVSHMFFKAAQDAFNTVTVVPGAISLWNRKALLSIGGYTSDTLAEDADATLRVILHGKSVRYWTSIRAKTEAPLTIKMHYKQRTRWQLGNMQAVYKHRDALLNSNNGSLGVIGLPFFYVDLVAALLYPILFAFALFVVTVQFFDLADFIPHSAGFIVSPLFAAYSLSMFAIEISFAIGAILIERRSIWSKLGLLLTIPYYMIVYRFILSFATIVAGLWALRGTLHGWGHLTRTASVK